MPRKSMHVCFYPGCQELTRERYCEKHRKTSYDNRRESAAKRGYGSKWAKARLAFLAEHPTCECERCKASGQPLPADVVDHIIPHKGNQKLFLIENEKRPPGEKSSEARSPDRGGLFFVKIS